MYGSKTRSAPALRGEAFLAKWNGLSAGELFSRIRRSMPLDHPASLSNETNTDLVAFIMQMNGFPQGNRELPADLDVMETIQIVSQKK